MRMNGVPILLLRNPMTVVRQPNEARVFARREILGQQIVCSAAESQDEGAGLPKI